MSDLTILAATIKGSVLDIAKQAKGLADGLQNVAPGSKTGTPNNSIQYLFSIHEGLGKIAAECEKLISQTMGEKKSL